MPNFFCFRPENFRYFGCLPIQMTLGLAVFVVFATQYYSIIFFLIQHVWYWFIALFVSLLVHAILFWAIYSKKGVLFYPLMIYQTLFALLMVGCCVWMIIDLAQPQNSWIYKRCLSPTSDENYCQNRTRTLAGINLAVFLVSTLLNLFVLDVFFRFRLYLEASNRRPAVNVVSNELAPPTSRRPTYNDPTHNIIYSPGNAYQPQPLYPPQQVPQEAPRPPYPTIREPTAPVYPASPAPLHRLYDAPPAYSQALTDEKY